MIVTIFDDVCVKSQRFISGHLWPLAKHVAKRLCKMMPQKYYRTNHEKLY